MLKYKIPQIVTLTHEPAWREYHGAVYCGKRELLYAAIWISGEEGIYKNKLLKNQ